MCGCEQGTCPGQCPCGCNHTPPLTVVPTPAADAAVCQCGHPERPHHVNLAVTGPMCQGDGWDCPCIAFVADVNRPDPYDPLKLGPCSCEHPWAIHDNGGQGACTHDAAPEYADENGPSGLTCGCDRYERLPAAVPAREGATEQLAALLAAHRHFPNNCSCGHTIETPSQGDPKIIYTSLPSDAYRAHVAAVILAAGWRRP